MFRYAYFIRLYWVRQSAKYETEEETVVAKGQDRMLNMSVRY